MDSFFGFDSSISVGDLAENGDLMEPPEEEYDALNDETFGSSLNYDWEEAHESLVRLTDNHVGNGDKDFRCRHRNVATTSSMLEAKIQYFNSDLELNLSNMKLDDVDIHIEKTENVRDEMGSSGKHFDSSVWTLPTGVNTMNNVTENTGDLLRTQYHSQFKGLLKNQELIHTGFDADVENISKLQEHTQLGESKKICTLEDIERSLLNQTAIQTTMQPQKTQLHDQRNYQEKHQLLNDDVFQSSSQTASSSPQPHQKFPKHHAQQAKVPPGFSNQYHSSRLINKAALPLQSNQHQQQQKRVPPGFAFYPPGPPPHLQHQTHLQLPAHPLLSQHGLSSNFHHSQQRQLPSAHLPVALNNFAMHPNFNSMRAAAAVAGIRPAALLPQTQPTARLPPYASNSTTLHNNQQTNSMYNMFNTRLVQEIQQNHPLLQNAVRQHNGGSVQLHNQMQQRMGMSLQNSQRYDSSGTGNLPHDEFDEYANLMSTRDKHWLIGIQLSQLNTDTPYIDDYYYTVYRERKAATSGKLHHSQAHTDNQLNHPLTQPKGHAQLVLVQMGNKNGIRNGQQRERHNSETSSNVQEQKTPYVFTPLKFENSLGKLQYGSVTAPRKIIDAEIMGGNAGCANDYQASGSIHKDTSIQCLGKHKATENVITDIPAFSQRKSRHILLHIETLYQLLLKLEDLENPIALATILMKKKKENERISALEQIENANKTPEERLADVNNHQVMNSVLRYKFAYEIETKEALVFKLISGLSHDRIVAMMTVRKGKILIRRLLPYITDRNVRWVIWIGVFSSLQNIVKKDRDDVEGVLYGLYPGFKSYLKNADFKTIVTISQSISFNDKQLYGIFCSRFGFSSLVCLILRAESIFVKNSDDTLDDIHLNSWRCFLKQVASALNRTIQSQSICTPFESDYIQPIINHIARFRDIKLNSLLGLIMHAKQQIH